MSSCFIVLSSCLVLAVAVQGSGSYLGSGVAQPISAGAGLIGSSVGSTSTIGVRPVAAHSVGPAPVGHHGRRPVIGLPAPVQSGASYRRTSSIQQGPISRRPIAGHYAPVQSGIPSRSPVIGRSGPIQHASLTKRPSAQVLHGSVHNHHRISSPY